jgi:hypothetical protein
MMNGEQDASQKWAKGKKLSGSQDSQDIIASDGRRTSRFTLQKTLQVVGAYRS